MFLSFAETFKALSDPVRREILELLKTGRMSAGEIASHFDMTQATVSYHLKILKKADQQIAKINEKIAEKSTVYKAAQDAMNGWDPTSGCIYYFNPDTATNTWIWSRPFVKKIGKHRFCK